MKRLIAPPKWPLKLLRLFIKSEYLEEIEGDMEEIFRDNLENHSHQKAIYQYIVDVIKLLRPAIIKNIGGTRRLNHYGMFKNQLKTSFRSLNKHATFSCINIIGLAIGLSSCIHLVQFVTHEFSYDHFINDSDRIYRMVLEREYSDRKLIKNSVPHSFAKVAVQDHPEIESAAVFSGPFRDMLISYETDGQQMKYHENVVAADSNFISFFGLPMLKGNAKTALKKPRSMVLTQSMAQKHFGDTNPLGEVIRMSGDDFKVTGVCEDLPENTHLKFDFLISIHSIRRFNSPNFTKPDVGCYFKLQPGTDWQSLQDKFPSMLDKHLVSKSEYRYFLTPLSSVYLHPDDLGGMKASGNITSTWIILTVAGLILVLAGINFINLSTAKSIERAKEVGIRKILGSHKRQLIMQFLIESFILTLVSVIVAAVIVIVTQPYFNAICEKNLALDFSPKSIGFLAAITLFISLMAGLYPAFVLSSFKPSTVLKGRLATNTKGHWLRDGLVVFQFFISISLVIGMLVMQGQIRYLLDKHLGFDKEQLLIVTGDFHMEPDFAKSFVDELRSIPEVIRAAGTLSAPSMGLLRENKYKKKDAIDVLSLKSMIIGDQFAEVLGLKLLEGRFFSEKSRDSLSILLNLSAVKVLGLKNPIGAKIAELSSDGTKINYEVIGIVEDFNFDYLYNDIAPLVINSNEMIYNRAGKLVARLNASFNLATIEKVESLWKKHKPDQPFTFKFLDHVLDSFYKKEQRLMKIFKVFSSLSILIACLGLFALSAHTTSMRTKEIGIRKVIGANSYSILYLLGSRFTLMIMISFLLAAPIASYCLQHWWLNSFAYRIDIQWDVILLAGLGSLLLAWVTIAFQILKAANVNPIISLSNE